MRLTSNTESGDSQIDHGKSPVTPEASDSNMQRQFKLKGATFLYFMSSSFIVSAFPPCFSYKHEQERALCVLK
jgi:hypothetical protein